MQMIPFNKPYMTGKELFNIAQAHFNGMLAGDGPFTKQCQRQLEEMTGATKVLLTHSCTAALEMAAIVCDLRLGDEVIMPSFTFVSTANAIVLRGANPVFADIDPDTLNLDPAHVAELINERTKAIVVVHYAGGCGNLDALVELARRHNLVLIEDAAQAINSTYKGRPLGTFGAIGALSFHETKNVISGEGGAILFSGEWGVQRGEIIREKGTNRSQFLRGQIDKYSWVDIGSSYLPGEVVAAFLSAQLDECDTILAARLSLWERYHLAFAHLELQEKLRRPRFHAECKHNAHMYYVLLPDGVRRDDFIAHMRGEGVQAIFHYVPLHSSSYSKKAGIAPAYELPVTDWVSEHLVRLPLWIGLEEHQDRVICAVESYFS